MRRKVMRIAGGSLWIMALLMLGACSNKVPNQAPTVQDQNVSTLQNHAVSILLQAEDEDNQTLEYNITQPPAHGSLSGTAPNVVYTPAHSFTGEDAFLFAVSDGIDNSKTATVRITVNPMQVFGFGDPDHGLEPWVTDGTSSGTERLTDLNPKRAGVQAFSGVKMGGVIYFAGGDETVGWGLWKINSAGEAEMVSRLERLPGDMVVVGTKLFFSSWTKQYGSELWVSDGTEAGTKMVKDIVPGASGSNPDDEEMVAMNGYLYFTASSTGHGEELWRSDGTAAGTQEVADINPGGGDSSPGGLAALSGTLYFRADDGTTGRELWKSNGAIGNAVQVKDIKGGASSSGPSGFTQMGSWVYFSADDGTHGAELWRTDGTAGNTAMVKNINNTGGGSGSNDSDPSRLTVMNGKLYFAADDGLNGEELWVSDGTSANTQLVRDINTHGSDASEPDDLTAVNGKLYFTANDGTHGKELWESDGTFAGTQLVEDIKSGSEGSNISSLYGVGNILYFIAYSGGDNLELWKHDSVGATTEKIVEMGGLEEDIFANKGGMIYLMSLAYSPNAMFFRMSLYRSDGSGSGTEPVLLSNGATASAMGMLGFLDATMMGGDLYFTATNGSIKYELYKSDGTVSGTALVKNLWSSGTNSSLPMGLTLSSNRLFFTAMNTSNGTELYVSDGSAAGTHLVRDIYPGSKSGCDLWFGDSKAVDNHGTIFFAADDGHNGTELWKSDGTYTGTEMVKDVESGANDSDPEHLTVWNGNVFFSAYDSSKGRELWKSDGTASNTVRVKDIRSGFPGSSPSNLAGSGSYLYFSANDGTAGREFWRSDGTAAGTVQVKDINPTGDSDPENMTDVNGVVYFSGNDGTTGHELWKSDGTPAGTVQVQDIYAGASSSNPKPLKAYHNKLLFAAHDSSAETPELWISNGTSAGTVKLKTFNGAGGLEFMKWTIGGRQLFYVVYADRAEVWATDGTSGGTEKLTDESISFLMEEGY